MRGGRGGSEAWGDVEVEGSAITFASAEGGAGRSSREGKGGGGGGEVVGRERRVEARGGRGVERRESVVQRGEGVDSRTTSSAGNAMDHPTSRDVDTWSQSTASSVRMTSAQRNAIGRITALAHLHSRHLKTLSSLALAATVPAP